MSYPFELEALSYAYDALEPFIDKETMELHHSKHLQTYMTNLNNALELHTEFHNWSIEQLISNLELLPTDIRRVVHNNGGGVYNHNLFFDILSSDSIPPTSGLLFDEIVNEFGSVDRLKEELKSAGLFVFGSGWVWLVADQSGKLSIITTANQDAPELEIFNPVINMDVWEHAYYLKNQNRRPEYIDNFLNVINWKEAEKNYKKIKNSVRI